MSVRGEDILKALQEMMRNDAHFADAARRQAHRYAQQPRYERGVHGEIIKPVKPGEAEIVASEINPLPDPP